MVLAKESLMEPIDMHELKAEAAGGAPAIPPRGNAAELYEKVNALGIGAQGLGGLSTVLDVKILDYPTHAASLPVAIIPNCGDAPCAFHARRIRCGQVRSTGPRTLARRALDAIAAGPPRESRRVDPDRGRLVAARRAVAAQWQAAHRARRGAQAHRRYAGKGRKATGSLHQPRDLLRRPGGSARKGAAPRDRQRRRAWTSSPT